MDYEEQNEYSLERYMELGVITVEGMDENGEIVYAINETAKDLAPELWQAHLDYVDSSLLKLYEAGLVKIEYDENLEVTLHLSQEGHNLAKELGLVELNFDEPPNN